MKEKTHFNDLTESEKKVFLKAFRKIEEIQKTYLTQVGGMTETINIGLATEFTGFWYLIRYTEEVIKDMNLEAEKLEKSTKIPFDNIKKILQIYI